MRADLAGFCVLADLLPPAGWLPLVGPPPPVGPPLPDEQAAIRISAAAERPMALGLTWIIRLPAISLFPPGCDNLHSTGLSDSTGPPRCPPYATGSVKRQCRLAVGQIS